jgi:hypothetical protein
MSNISNLTSEQAANYRRFTKSLPKDAGEVKINKQKYP